jgi:hypothetical protein
MRTEELRLSPYREPSDGLNHMEGEMPRPSYSEAEVAGAVLAVKANRGYVKPVADAMGLKSQTLGRWVRGDRRAAGAAKRAAMVHKQEQALLEGFLESALRAQELAMSPEKLEKASSYQLMLMSAVGYDKFLLGTGRPTSRSETLKARYVEPEALRKISSTAVIEATAKALPEPA